MKIKTFAFIIGVILLCGGCSRLAYIERQTGVENLPYPHIRVRIMEGHDLNVMGEGTYRLNCILGDSTAKGYYSVAPLKVISSRNGMTLSEQSGFVLDTGLAIIYVSPKNRKSHLLIDSKPFRGILEIRSSDNKIEVINVLNIEDYLMGVLPPEIGRLDRDAFQALKAQSVAARTYAYSRIISNSGKHYDLVNDIMDQVYKGIRGEYDLANKAIAETRGEILTYEGKPITAYYHSTCGGMTEDVANVWDQHVNGYLKSVDDGDFCAWSKFCEWEMTWTPHELAGYIADYMRDKREFTGDSLVLRDIRIIERFPTGRISHLEVSTDQGTFLFFKDQIRWAFRRPGRPDQILPSSNFELRLWRDLDGNLTEITSAGRGYGHGVGMCQTGAIGRARAGQDYETILKTYYSGVEITRAY